MEKDKKSGSLKRACTSPLPPCSPVPEDSSPSSAATVTAAAAVVAAAAVASSASAATTRGPAPYNPEIELSTDTEDSSSDVAGKTGKSLDHIY
jgi:hypothetical protein